MNTADISRLPIVLTIAGSDSGGGAGIQADIKAIQATGSYAASAITAVTVQNTIGVQDVLPIPVDTVKAQIKAVFDDLRPDAVKIGMLANSQLVIGIQEALQEVDAKNIVLDPVMVATSGDRLLENAAIRLLINVLAPMAQIITPNISEAESLTGITISYENELPVVGRSLSKMIFKESGKKVSVLMKAGHMNGEILTDYFYNACEDHMVELPSKRIHTQNTHGTGCTMSSALASFLAHGMSLDDAARAAKEYMTKVIESGARYQMGHGHGPVDHFYMLHQPNDKPF